MSRPAKQREYCYLWHDDMRVYRVTYHLDFTEARDSRLVAANSPSEAIRIMKRELSRPENYSFKAERATVLAVWGD